MADRRERQDGARGVGVDADVVGAVLSDLIGQELRHRRHHPGRRPGLGVGQRVERHDHGGAGVAGHRRVVHPVHDVGFQDEATAVHRHDRFAGRIERLEFPDLPAVVLGDFVVGQPGVQAAGQKGRRPVAGERLTQDSVQVDADQLRNAAQHIQTREGRLVEQGRRCGVADGVLRGAGGGDHLAGRVGLGHHRLVFRVGLEFATGGRGHHPRLRKCRGARRGWGVAVRGGAGCDRGGRVDGDISGRLVRGLAVGDAGFGAGLGVGLGFGQRAVVLEAGAVDEDAAVVTVSVADVAVVSELLGVFGDSRVVAGSVIVPVATMPLTGPGARRSRRL